MALTKNYPTGDPVFPTAFYGCLVRLLPAQDDPNLLFELQRAPDAAGAPDTANAVSLGTNLGPYPPSGGVYADPRPRKSTSVLWWYRARHVGPTGGDSDWSAWDNYHAMQIPLNTLDRLLRDTNVYPLDPTQAISGQGRSLSALVSTPELVPNAEFDLWTSDAQPYSWTVDTGDSSSAAKETVLVFSGDAALKYTFGGGGAAGTYRGVTTNDPVKGAFCLPLRPGRTYRFLIASRVSSIAGGGESYRLTLTFNVGATLTASKTFAYAAATTYQVDEWQVSVPTAAEANSRLAVEFTRSNTTTHDFWVDSLRVLEDAPSAAVIAAQIAQAGGDFVQNGLFEQGVAYWRQTSGGSLDSTTSSPIEGLVSGKVVEAVSTTHRIQQCDRSSDLSGANPAGGTPIYVPVQPFDEIFGSVKYSRSSGADIFKFGIEEYDIAKSLIQRTYLATDTAGPGPTTIRGGIVLSSTTRYVVAIFEVLGNVGSGGIVIKVDEYHLYRADAKRRVKAWSNAAQTIANNVETGLTFNQEDYDVGSTHDTVANTSKLNIPIDWPLVGVVIIHGSVDYVANGAGIRIVRVRKNGITPISTVTFQPIGTVHTGDDVMAIVDMRSLVPGTDYFEITTIQTSGGNLNTTPGADFVFGELLHVY